MECAINCYYLSSGSAHLYKLVSPFVAMGSQARFHRFYLQPQIAWLYLLKKVVSLRSARALDKSCACSLGLVNRVLRPDGLVELPLLMVS